MGVALRIERTSLEGFVDEKFEKRKKKKICEVGVTIFCQIISKLFQKKK